MKRTFVNFEGQVCLVTGAGSASGIGFETAKLLGGLGARIALTSTTERIHEREAELKEQGIDAKGYVADLMNRQQVKKLVEDVVADFGKIDALINNAGMVQTNKAEEDFSHIADMTYENWDTSIDRNLNITFNVTKCVLPYMIRGNYGRIVNVSSVTGPVVSNPGEAAYSAAKAGIVGMSRALAIEVGVNNITVNCVLPGWIGTASQTESEAAGGLNTPMRRSADPSEVANAIVFLASRESSYITGESLVVDGGNTIQEYKGPAELYY